MSIDELTTETTFSNENPQAAYRGLRKVSYIAAAAGAAVLALSQVGCTSNTGMEFTAFQVKAGHKGTIKEPNAGEMAVQGNVDPYTTRGHHGPTLMNAYQRARGE